MTAPRCLAICLFFNDDDLVDDALAHMLDNNHDLIVWDHGSSDGTAAAIDRFAPHIRERHFLPRSFDFYNLFEHVSRYVIDNLASQYDWISFPESDEFLEGPDRSKSYYDHVCDVVASQWDWVQFNNIVYWFTDQDDPSETSPRKRIKHYSIWRDCPPRVYAWRARCSNVRFFNHNPAEGLRYPVNFNTCHYHIRSEAHLEKRIRDRTGLSRGTMNTHFDSMERNRALMRIPARTLNLDNGGELSLQQTVAWARIYRG